MANTGQGLKSCRNRAAGLFLSLLLCLRRHFWERPRLLPTCSHQTKWHDPSFCQVTLAPGLQYHLYLSILAVHRGGIFLKLLICVAFSCAALSTFSVVYLALYFLHFSHCHSVSFSCFDYLKCFLTDFSLTKWILTESVLVNTVIVCIDSIKPSFVVQLVGSHLVK